MASDTTHRWLRRSLLFVFAIAALLIAAAAWLLATENGAQAALSVTHALFPDMPRIGGLHGRLIGPLRIERLEVDGVNQRIVLSDIALDWQAAALRQRKLHIQRLRIGQIGITSKLERKQEPPRLPDNIALPFDLQADSVHIQSGEFNRGPVNLLRFGPVAFQLAFDNNTYQLQLRQFAAGSATEQGRFTTSFSGQMRLSSIKPYPLQASISSSSHAQFKDQPIGVNGGIDLSGSLAEMLGKLDLIVNRAPVNGQVVLRPFSDQALGATTLTARGLDLSALKDTLPATALDIRLSVTESGAGEMHLNNAAAGTYDTKKLPLSSLAVSFRQKAGEVDFNAIAASLGSAKLPAGEVTGDGQFAGGALTLSLHTDALNLQRVDARARATRLAGQVDLRNAAGRQEVTVALSEPLQAQRIVLDAHGVVADQELAIDSARLQVGRGQLQASGRLAFVGRQGFMAQGQISNFRLQELGTFPQAPSLELNGSFSLSGTRMPQLEADLAFKISDSRLAGHALMGDGQAQLRADRLLVPKFLLQSGVNRLQVLGQLAQADARLTFSLDAPQLAQLGPAFAGAAQASGVVSGSLTQPHINANWNASKLRAPGELQIDVMQGKADIRIDRERPFILDAAVVDMTASGLHRAKDKLSALSAELVFGPQPDAPLALKIQANAIEAGRFHADALQLAAQGTTARHAITAALNETGQSLSLKLDGGLDKLGTDARWQGNLNAFEASGRLNAQLVSPAALFLSSQRMQLDHFIVNTQGARIAVERFARDAGVTVTQGRIENLQFAELLRQMNRPPSVKTDLRLGGEWDVRLTDTLTGNLSLRRESGDVTVLGQAPVTLGLRTLVANADASNGRLSVQLQTEGSQLGRIDLHADTGIGTPESPVAIAQEAPISGSARVDLPALAAIVPLFSPTLSTDGHLQTEINAAGTFGDPRLTGRIDGSGLRLAFADLGIDLRQGVLHGEFQDNQLLVRELAFTGAEGRVWASGPISLAGGDVGGQLTLHAEHFALLNRIDRRMVVSGDTQVALRERHLKLTGALAIERGFIDLGRADRPHLSDDVVIVGRTEKQPARMAAEIDVTLASDGDITLTGRGLNGKLAGKIRLLSSPGEKLRAQGTLSIVKGTYTAYGRELAIEQGLLRFNGPLNNPALDILAMRRGQEVEAGISVRGSALDPRVTLVSEPSVPDAEKLSWLVLGRGLSTAGESDVGALQSAASALLSQGAAAGVQSGIASAFGLDTFSLGTSQDNLQQRIITVGKQISSKLYLAYQQGLQSAESVVQLRYVLSPRLSLEAEGGTRSAFSIFYNIGFD